MSAGNPGQKVYVYAVFSSLNECEHGFIVGLWGSRIPYQVEVRLLRPSRLTKKSEGRRNLESLRQKVCPCPENHMSRQAKPSPAKILSPLVNGKDTMLRDSLGYGSRRFLNGPLSSPPGRTQPEVRSLTIPTHLVAPCG